MLYFSLFNPHTLVKKRLTVTVLDGELLHHRARTEYIAVHCDVGANDLGENPPGLQPPM